MRLRLHPSGVELGAWFDDEATDGVGAHVTRCSRCQRQLAELARVRAWVRAQPLFAMSGDEEPAPRVTAGRRWPALVTVAALVFTLVRIAADRPGGGADPVPQALSRPAADDNAAAPAPSTTAETPASVVSPQAPGTGQQQPAGRGAPVDRAGSAGPSGGGADRSVVNASNPLRLGLIVPTKGALAAEGEDVRRAVARRVDLANAAGGVAGRAVELVVAPAEDAVAVASLPQRVTVIVGGFGASPPPGSTWLLPADPAIAGTNVLTTESQPRAAGVQLGTMLLQQGLNGPVGVVLGTGPEADLFTGLALKVPTTTVPARAGSDCSAEVASLRRAGSVALAVAGDAALAVRCLQAAVRSAWLPQFGSVVSPSAAYGSLLAVPEAWGARTVLALPWPSSPLAGAIRFRESANSTSYRAQISFAAAELAVEVARRTGRVSLESIGSTTWSSDLLTIVGTAGRPGVVVVAGPTGWLPAPSLALLRPF